MFPARLRFVRVFSFLPTQSAYYRGDLGIVSTRIGEIAYNRKPDSRRGTWTDPEDFTTGECSKRSLLCLVGVVVVYSHSTQNHPVALSAEIRKCVTLLLKRKLERRVTRVLGPCHA